MKPRPILLALVAVAVLCACSTVRVRQDYDPNEDFSRLRRYAWYPAQPRPTGDLRLDNPLLHGRIQSAVDRWLAARGYRLIETPDPDFYVNFHLSMQSKLDVRTIDHGYYAGGPYGGRWGGVGWAGPGWTETYAVQYDEGTLAIDVIDARQRKLVWRGFGTGRLREQPKPEEARERVDRAVAEILEQFPPR